MIHKIFVIYDAAAAAYFPPFFIHEEGIAIRTFTDCVNDKEHPFGKHPKDYTLMEIGVFDDANGKITTLQTQKPLGNGLSFVQKSADPDHMSILEEVK